MSGHLSRAIKSVFSNWRISGGSECVQEGEQEDTTVVAQQTDLEEEVGVASI